MLNRLIEKFSPEALTHFMRSRNDKFRSVKEAIPDAESEYFSDFVKVGEIDFESAQKLIVISARAQSDMNFRSSRQYQFEQAKKIIYDFNAVAGIFAFYDENGNFRFSLVHASYDGTKRYWNNFRRYTFFVTRGQTNKTFKQRVGNISFASLDSIREAFSVDAVTNEFYQEFDKIFQKLVDAVADPYGEEIKESVRTDFALLFAIRTIFLGFIQKKKWLGNDEQFIQNYWNEYCKTLYLSDKFYADWLKPLFLKALNRPPGSIVVPNNSPIPEHYRKALQMAPYLNGGLFEAHAADDSGYFLPDKEIKGFVDFLFSHNFTIEENSPYDEVLELNPEFLGIIFERLINKKDGAVYTPRIEVDFMCRMALVKWLEKNTSCDLTDLYRFFFFEGGEDGKYDHDNQRKGDFSTRQLQELKDKLENITVCDPAAGSGAFEVGMLQVLFEVQSDILMRLEKVELDDEGKFQLKERIIGKSLYGVEVKEWAVWINQLRLWLSLFIDAPESMRNSLKPILPSLDFKVRCGDSLVQRIGSKTFPVQGHANIGGLKGEVTKLKNAKIEYYNNDKQHSMQNIRRQEFELFCKIINAEIKDLDDKITENSKQKFNPDMFKSEHEQLEFNLQDKSKTNPKELELLKAQRQELIAQCNSLNAEHPLIWNIEFAEIFSERGGFDIIIGNPPYIRQEKIADPNGRLEPKEYKDALIEMVKGDFPDGFGLKDKINGQSDLYTYFYVRALRLLNENGIHCFICSNSWLDVGYGVWLQKFLLDNVPIHFIIDNQAKRSFASAQVNTIISIFGAPIKKLDHNAAVKFVAFKKPFEESVFSENLLDIEKNTQITANIKLRCYPVLQHILQAEGTEYDSNELVNKKSKIQSGKYVGAKWGGRYLRAPDIFFTVLEKGKDKLIQLKDIADVKRGITTGNNDFFYLTPAQAKKWRIEKEFLQPVLKSPRECTNYMVKSNNLDLLLFKCPKPKTELQGTNALQYIEFGEQYEVEISQGGNKGKKIKGYNNLESVKNRKIWYSVDEVSGNVFWGKELRERLATFFSDTPLVADCRFYCAHVPDTLKFFCNSTIYTLFGETLKRDLGGGGGPRSVMVYEVQNSLVLSPKLFTPPVQILNEIGKREVKTFFEECGINPESDIPIEEQEPNPLPDRKVLDDIVFDAIGLTQEERKEVYRAVCRLVWNRISKANSL